MKLAHLRTACYLYNQFSDYDAKYLSLSTKYPNLQLNDKDQVIALIEWLRSWGCRQFKKTAEKASMNSIMKWYEINESKLPSSNDCLIDYDLSANKKTIIDLFNDLSNRRAATKERGDQGIDVRIGPVGAAKTLFVLRSNLFSPWDTPIYKKLNLEGDGSGYIGYLSIIQKELKEVRAELSKSGIEWNALLEILDKRHKAYPKVIDEYFWITITRRCDPAVIENFFKLNGR
ncbi:MAG: hypothetical protein A2V86_13865 [Deltaproteobacteria bacterium RBG_16_49_23]|nr:MAG: hypothetical protein A2V86_13865 [Deltaproteobacteria bacterium RBG_16_49_23]